MQSSLVPKTDLFDLVTSDGVILRAFAHVPANPKAVVLLAHGYGEHSGRYRHVISALNEHNFAVYTIDLRGHGQCTGRRATIRRFDSFVDDFELLVAHAKQKLGTRPLFLLGHSMGGLIAVRYALKHQPDLAGMVVTGPAMILGADISPLQTKVLLTLSRVAPELGMIPSDTSLFSRNPDVGKAFMNDPLCYSGRVRLGFARELYLAGKETCSHLHDITIPFLVMHGAEDHVTSPRGSERLYAEATSKDKTLKLWPDDRHELFNELDADDVIRVTCEWFDAHA